MVSKKFFVYTFYKFFNLDDKNLIKKLLDNYLTSKTIKGTILLADEGINASVSGSKEELESLLAYLKRILKIRTFVIKSSETNFLPFNRIKVRLKKEIVSLGVGAIDVEKYSGELIHPSKWDNIIKCENVELIDVRNIFEIKIGSFKNSINPKTKSFREFPEKIKRLNIKKSSKLAIYCTGGIRCEKASAYLKINGYKDVVQLDGGIINYLNYMKTKNNKISYWNGECFVFDSRVTINKSLLQGNFTQCHGCRHPLTKEEVTLSSYIKGVHCKYCINTRSKTQKQKSFMRQKQIEKAEKMNRDHSFKKISV